MARPIVLSNGSLHVGLNHYGLVHDFYFPYVGLENHSAGPDLRHKIGVWIDGVLSWLDDDPAWVFNFTYPHHSLIGHTTATHTALGIRLEFDDCVDSSIDVLLRNIHIVNLCDQPREIRLFMHQAFAIGDSRSNTDTAQYLPDNDAILHYRGRRAFVISGMSDGKPFDQYTVGLFGIEGREGTYRDADDGELCFGNVEHGRVDSTLRFLLIIEPHGSARVHYWIAAGTSLRKALAAHKQVCDVGLDALTRQTASWWHEWLKPALSVSERLPDTHRESFVRSVIVMKSQIDKRGAVIASTDTTMLNYSRDAYAYSWPRDGAYVVWPLIRMGYTEEALEFFRFCLRGLHPNGYLMHKYRADGALGSSWHPYVHNGISTPPIQEDETALVLFVFVQYYMMHPDQKLLDEFYDSMVKPMANFMASYIDEITHLPKPSYDLWEEVFMTTTYTTSVVYAALLVAADLAQEAHDNERAVAWRAAADDMQQGAQKHLYNPTRKAFYKGLSMDDGVVVPDETIDTSSLFGVFMFGLFAPNSQELQNAAETTCQVFHVTDQHPGLPRYENDDYHRTDHTILGNWWFVTSLWLAQYYTESGKTDETRRILDWVKVHMMTTGILSEQINPLDNTLLSVAPLTWSHAEYVATLLDTLTEAKS